jgi:hypothetical protein
MASLDDKLTTNDAEALLDFHGEELKPEADVLRQAYNSAMGRIENQRPGVRKIALRTLAWMTCAERPLCIAELQEGLGLVDNNNSVEETNFATVGDIVSACRGLITIDEKISTVQIHPLHNSTSSGRHDLSMVSRCGGILGHDLHQVSFPRGISPPVFQRTTVGGPKTDASALHLRRCQLGPSRSQGCGIGEGLHGLLN